MLGAEELDAAQTSLEARFQRGVQAGLEGTENDSMEMLMQSVDSDSSGHKYPVGLLLGRMKEVLGEVAVGKIGSWMQRVDNRPFALIIEVKIDDIEDDNLSVYMPAIEALGKQAQLYPLELMAEQLDNSFTTEWIDGSPVFYAGDRTWPVGQETWRNRYDLDLTAENVETLYDYQIQRVGPDGKTLGEAPGVLWHGPKTRKKARDAVEKGILATGEENMTAGLVDRVMLPRLSGNQWGVMVIDPVKPFVLQNRSGPSFIVGEKEKSHAAMYEEKIPYKGRRRCEVACLAPWMITASNG